MPVLDWLPTAVAVVLFLGAATVYLRGSRDKGTIATLTASNTALAERVGLLELDKTTLTTRVQVLEQANSVLEGVANSSAEIASFRAEMTTAAAELVGALGEHHTEAMERLDGIHTDLEQLKGQS